MQGLRFAVVGLIGFAVDGGLLSVLTAAGMGAIGARCISFPIAVATTFAINRRFTFRLAARRAASDLFVRYSALQLAGACTNFVIYVMLVQWFAEWRQMPLAPLGIAAACSTVLTYIGSKFIFEGPRA